MTPTEQAAVERVRAGLNNAKFNSTMVYSGHRLAIADLRTILALTETAEAKAAVMEAALTEIADGKVPDHHQNGHYLAHRNAVEIARNSLKVSRGFPPLNSATWRSTSEMIDRLHTRTEDAP